MPGTLMERHFGIVTNNDDPEKRNRLKVKSQSLTGADFELPDFIEPDASVFTSRNGGGSSWVPDIGTTVLLEVAAHDPDFDQMPGERFLQNPSARWKHAPHTAGPDAMPLPADLLKNYPKRRGFVTPAGHKLIFDDTEGAEAIIIESKQGHVIELVNNEIHITPAGTTVMKSPTLLGEGATELQVLGNLFLALFNSHVHVETGVNTAPPTVPMTAAQLSQEGNKVK